MLRLIGVVVSIGLADSLNPGTIAPALYLATGEHPIRRVLEFTVGVFVVYLLGGILIALGPGQLLLSLLPKPDAEDRHVLEIVVGAAMLLAAALLWANRERLARRQLPGAGKQGRHGAFLGATITALELPTAFPYFAAIAAIVGSGLSAPNQIGLLFVFNLCFVLPLLAMCLTLALAGERADALLYRAREFLQRKWPKILAVLLLLAGVLAVLLGATAFASRAHGRLGRLMRHVRHFLHP